MKNLTEKESLQLYGKIVADFVNAQDSDEAYLSIIKGIHKAFNFSSSFIEKAIKHFPSIKRIASNLGENLSEKEMELLKLYSKNYGIEWILTSQLETLMFRLEGYDLEKDKLVVYQEWDPEKGNIYIEINFDEKNKKAFLKQFEKYKPTDLIYKRWQICNQELLEVVKIYRELELKIRDLLDTVSEVGYSKIEKIYKYKSIDLHDRIIWIQKTIQIILKRIMEGKNLYNFELFDGILHMYNERYEKYLVFHSDGTFSYQTYFSTEERYLQTLNWIEERIEEFASGKYEGQEYESYLKEEVIDNLGSRCLEWYFYDIIFIFIEFMRLSNQKNLVNICNMCEKYFISQKDDSRIKFCPTCSPKSKISRERKNELQRIWRQKKKQEKIKKERETKILNFMDKLGCTRKEAEEIIEADESMM